ncbi:unnamed protein product [Natator depressus]
MLVGGREEVLCFALPALSLGSRGSGRLNAGGWEGGRRCGAVLCCALPCPAPPPPGLARQRPFKCGAGRLWQGGLLLTEAQRAQVMGCRVPPGSASLSWSRALPRATSSVPGEHAGGCAAVPPVCESL